MRAHLLLALVALLAGCAAPPPSSVLPSPTPVAYDAAGLSAVRYKAVLVAGDGSLAVFDNAVEGVAARLRDRGGLGPGEIQRLSASPAVVAREGVRSASLDHVLDAVAAMRPAPGQGCLVFATSHGVPYRGLVLAATGEVLGPKALDAALVRGCGDAPTVVVASGCFTGGFARGTMARPNRVVLTAARADRTSFGCGAGYTYTVYDRCLLDALDSGASGTWQGVYDAVRRCVTAEEARQRVTPSEPQAWFGPAVAAGLPVPGRPGTVRPSAATAGSAG